jgi:hypothetical protein
VGSWTIVINGVTEAFGEACIGLSFVCERLLTAGAVGFITARDLV